MRVRVRLVFFDRYVINGIRILSHVYDIVASMVSEFLCEVSRFLRVVSPSVRVISYSSLNDDYILLMYDTLTSLDMWSRNLYSTCLYSRRLALTFTVTYLDDRLFLISYMFRKICDTFLSDNVLNIVICREHGLLINHDYLTRLKLRLIFTKRRNIQNIVKMLLGEIRNLTYTLHEDTYILDLDEIDLEEKPLLCLYANGIEFTCVETNRETVNALRRIVNEVNTESKIDINNMRLIYKHRLDINNLNKLLKHLLNHLQTS